MNNAHNGQQWVLIIVVFVLSVALVIVLTVIVAHGAECRMSKGNPKLYWSWRQIDGRKCWYAGPPGVNKAALHWAKHHPEPVHHRRSPHKRTEPPPTDEADVWPKLERR